jgi:predicted XRE-type DNA-binding protein
MRITKSGGNVFSDIGFDAIEAEELAAKSDLVSLLARAIKARGLGQQEAAAICRADQPTLSKVLNGKLESVTIDRLARWIVALGATVSIRVMQPKKANRRTKGSIIVEAR